MEKTSACVSCSGKTCMPDIKAGESPPFDEAPSFCPMQTMPGVIKNSIEEYTKPEIFEFARKASIQEFECTEHLEDGLRTRIPRVEETMLFAKKCGYKKLGLAFCGGLRYEARIFNKMLENKGFEVISVCCKVSATPKEFLGLTNEKIFGADHFEAMCSPITQAEVLNTSGVELAIMLGLCVGHDSLFIKYCKAPVTVLAVKDRVFGHNPLAAIYLSQTYYHRLVGQPASF